MRLSFVQSLQDQTVKEGNTVRFDIELSHENVPVVWYRNEVKLHVSRTVLTYAEGRKHSLEMRSLSVDDTCQIKAEAKGFYSTAKLTVIGNIFFVPIFFLTVILLGVVHLLVNIFFEKAYFKCKC